MAISEIYPEKKMWSYVNKMVGNCEKLHVKLLRGQAISKKDFHLENNGRIAGL